MGVIEKIKAKFGKKKRENEEEKKKEEEEVKKRLKSLGYLQ